MISIHAPRMGSDVLTNFRVSAHAHFNPRSPDGERHGAAGLAHPRTDFNPRSPDGERQTPPKPTTRPPHFNPRSPDGERPDAPMRAASYPPYFNPRSPDGERRWEVSGYPSRDAFQSTLPGWGATTRNHRKRQRQDNFNPRSPDGERRFAPSAPRPIGSDFNPRSPDGERQVGDAAALFEDAFQSTLPGWGATYTAVCLGVSPYISIHAPRMGSDGHHGPLHQQPRKISIHAPRMGSDAQTFRRYDAENIISIHAPRMGSDFAFCHGPSLVSIFQSTLPGWGATTACPASIAGSQFQSTLPGWGATRPPSASPNSKRNFNPRSPDGERLNLTANDFGYAPISIHAPRMGSDRSLIASILSSTRISIHAPRMGSDLRQFQHKRLQIISIHAPRMGSDYSGEASLRIMLNFNPRSPDGERRYQ